MSSSRESSVSERSSESTPALDLLRAMALARGLTHAPWFGAAAIAAALVVGDLVIALGLNDPRFAQLVMLGLAGVGLALVFRFPFAAGCGVLVLVASVLEPGQFRMPAGPIEWRLEELILGALLIVAVVRPRRAWWGGVAGGALAVFFVVLGFAAVLALESGRAPFADVFLYCRFFAPLLLFYVIVRLFPEPDQVRRLLVVAVVLAAITGFVSLAASDPGSPIASLFNPSEDSMTIRDKEGLGLVNRVRLAGVSLAYVLFWYVAAQAIAAHRGGRLLAWLAALTGMTLSIVLSFNRNMWIGLVAGLLLMLLLGRTVSRRRLTAAVAVLVAGALAIAMSGPKLSTDSPLYPLVQRGTSLLNPEQEARDSSIQDRRLENGFAVETIERNPIIGVGPGAPYGADWLWVHNQYLHLLLIGGPAALLSLLVFLGAPQLGVLRRRSRDDTLLALAVGLAITMVSAIVMISFVNPTWAGVLALLTGAITVLRARPAIEPDPGAEGGTQVASPPVWPRPGRTRQRYAPVGAGQSRL
jgi:O-Antigen ligase